MLATFTGDVGNGVAPETSKKPRGFVFDIMRFSLHDGPGLRTAIFLKGCPLSCWWCHNPESQSPDAQIIFSEDRCVRCGSCVAACPNHALSWNDAPIWKKSLCRLCGDCAQACPSGARQLVGRWMNVDEAMEEAKKDLVFFDESGGGVTLSGGEPLVQPEFALAVLDACRANGIRTVVETCGATSRSTLLRAGNKADLILYDVKLMDPEKHRKYTGISNETILANLKALAETKKAIVVRIPIIPGINDDDVNLANTRRYVSSLGINRVDLLPYHEIGVNKYARLGMSYRLDGLKPPPREAVEEIARDFQRDGFSVCVGG